MEILESILSQEIVQRIGWTLVHFVWQGIAVAMLAAVVLKLLKKASSNFRYITACSALAVIVILPVVTFQMVEIASSSRSGTSRNDRGRGNDIYEMASNNIKQEITTAVNVPVQVAALPAIPLKERFVNAVEPILPYAVLGWLIGVAALSVWYLGGWTQLQRLRRRMVKQVSGDIKIKLKQLSQTFGISKAVEIVESAIVNVPTVIGYFKPMILLPASVMTGLSGEQIEAILAHELAHIKRCDYLVNILQTVVEILGFYHPAVWWISNKIRAERENCCDDIAVHITGDNINYASALATMEEIRMKATEGTENTEDINNKKLVIAASGGNLFNRIYRLLGKDSASDGKASWLPSVAAIVLIGLMIVSAVMAVTKAAEPQRHKSTKEIATPASSSTTPRQAEGTEIKKTEKQGDFKASLSNGTTVELIGVCEHPSEGKQWWRPDGTLLGKPPYETMGGKLTHDEGYSDYEFVLRTNGPGDASFNVQVPGGRHGTYTGTPYGQEDNRVENLRVYTVNQAEEKDKTLVRIGATAAQWQYRAVYRHVHEEGVYDLGNQQSVAFGRPYETGGDTVLPVTHNLNKPEEEVDIRIVAVKKDGGIWLSSCSGYGGNILHSSTYRFKSLPLEEIKEFLFQTRPYEWVEFKNVSLRPNLKTDVQVETEKLKATKVAEIKKTGPIKKSVANVIVSNENFNVLDVNFEPIRQGKNILWLTVQNKTDKEQLLGVHIYTRSPDYGSQGVGWGTIFYDTLKAGETKLSRFAYKIQGPVTDNTWLRLKFYNPESAEYNKDDKPFAEKEYASKDLKHKTEATSKAITSEDFSKIIIGNFIKIQGFIKDEKYKEAWEFFTEDYKKSEYQIKGLEAFERHMKPQNPIEPAFHWDKEQFLKLEPQHLDINARNNSITLLATYKKEIWEISFAKEGNEWKIDDIAGYRPAILDMQEKEAK